MKVSVYSTLWGLRERPTSFDIDGALTNWCVYADEVVVSCGDDYSFDQVQARAAKWPVRPIRTTFDFANDPLAYGKTENAAMQACTGDFLIQQNGDERLGGSKTKLAFLYAIMQADPSIMSFMIPTIDLYGSVERAVKTGLKWYVSRAGLYRGPVKWGLKPDGRPDYNKTSTDELIDKDGNLAPTVHLIDDLSIENVRLYVAAGNLIVYHLGFLSLSERSQRAVWWRDFWLRATNGDPNSHITDVAELEKRHTFEHGLPLWPTKEVA